MTTTSSDTELYTSPVIVQHEQYTVREMELTWEKAALLWTMISKFKTLFSDITRGDINNFLRFVTDGNSVWLEIYAGPNFLGIVCFTNMYKIVDTDAHVIFFDRELANKVELCKKIVRWAFDTFPLQRISVDVPAFYYRTIRLVRNIGFRMEGERRRAVLLGGNWINVLLFGLLRSDVYSQEEGKP